MSLPPLATVDDVAVRLFRDLADDEIPRLEALLGDVSAVIRNYCRQDFSSTRATQRLRPIGYRIHLPHRPVVAVHSVALLIQGVATTVAGYTWDGLDEIWLADAGQIINLAETAREWLATHTPVAEVDYTAGFATAPLDVVSVVCSMVSRSLSAPGGGGIISEGVGEYTYRLSDAVMQGPLTLTEAERSVLASYRPAAASIELRW